jgi:hypothetical protein
MAMSNVLEPYADAIMPSQVSYRGVALTMPNALRRRLTDGIRANDK